jgi:short-subunit dehydrogenase
MTEAGSCDASSLYTSPLLVVSMMFAFPTLFWLVAYLVPQLYMAFRSVPNLKEKYSAEWALVTGGGSGIGKSLSFKLASQGLNVVLVSLDDEFLKSTMKELKDTYPKQEFRAVGVNFAPGVKYMDDIIKATKDLFIPIVFCNAGFMVTGFLDQAPIEKLLTNIECNATSAVNVSHHFVKILVSKKKKGCIVFTSSVAGFIPTPFAAMYASTKAFVSQYAACMHIEVKPLGIDVCAIHPSPVSSNFYKKLDHKVEMIEVAAQSAVTPDSITDDMLRSIGPCALRDMGGRYLLACVCVCSIVSLGVSMIRRSHSLFAVLVRNGVGNSHGHLLPSLQLFCRSICFCSSFSSGLEDAQQESLNTADRNTKILLLARTI